MIGVLGAGAFGTAMAISLTKNDHVVLWARDREKTQSMNHLRQNVDRLPDVDFPDNLQVTSEIADLAQCDVLLFCIPTQKTRFFLTENDQSLPPVPRIACCKGVELDTRMRPTQIVASAFQDAVTAMLTGPSFAADIARGLPTALTLATSDDDAGKDLQNRLSTANLRLYRTTDVIGSELGGALKNVVAIACGAAMGAGLGESARAALMTRGFAEMTRYAEQKGARAETLAGLSGFGDLALTCTSAQSRNYRFGTSLGQSGDFDTSITVEGAATSQAIVQDAEQSGLDLPITQAVAGLSSGELKVAEAIDMLLSRPLREE